MARVKLRKKGDVMAARYLFIVAALAVVGVGIMYSSSSGITGAAVHGYEYRTFDGTGNNLMNPVYGSAGIPLLRISGSAYADGISAPAGAGRKSAREISNIVVAQAESIPSSIGASDHIWQWGQFLDHDLDLTVPAAPREPFNILVPTGDPFFDPYSTGTQYITLDRAMHDGGSPRQQINIITAWIDASNVYGSGQVRADALRTFVDGKLKTSAGNLPPYNTAGHPNGGGLSPSLFFAGDVRINEQIGLTAIHALFVREHNRVADMIKASNPGLSDEDIYQWTRKVLGAEMQVITYEEWLPIIIGKDAIPKYKGYNPTINPGIANEFSTASFRFGHTLLSENILRIKNDGTRILVPLRNSFFNPAIVPMDDSTTSILRGLAAQLAQDFDNKIVNDVRNFLFGSPGSGGFDLASLNIQRGRDHGLPDYNSVRVAYGLPAVTSFAEISSNQNVQEALALAYGTVDDIDLWVGGLAEDPEPGAMVGLTLRAVLADQFTRVRDGDRFWYENDPFFKENKYLLNYVKKITLSEVIRGNTEVGDELQKEAFFVKKYG